MEVIEEENITKDSPDSALIRERPSARGVTPALSLPSLANLSVLHNPYSLALPYRETNFAASGGISKHHTSTLKLNPDRKKSFSQSVTDSATSVGGRTWTFCGWTVSKECVTYLTKTFFLYILVVACVVNVSLNIKPVELWITLLILSLSGMGLNTAGTVIAREKQIQSSLSQSTSNH